MMFATRPSLSSVNSVFFPDIGSQYRIPRVRESVAFMSQANSIILRVAAIPRRLVVIAWAKIRMAKIKRSVVIRQSSTTGQPNGRKVPLLFNLDLHIAVIRDLERHLNRNEMDLVNFSISGHNWALPNRPPIPDPVKIVSNKTWRELDQNRIKMFQTHYAEFLRNFDGFVVTHTPSFVELYCNMDKPVLCVVSTRYEAPYTNSQTDWDRLNNVLLQGHGSGNVQIIANNRGDADYLKYFTGIEVRTLPSLCDLGYRWSGSLSKKVFICKDQELSREIEFQTDYLPVHSLGSPYSFADLMDCREVLVIPQNISTMSLFELATAGCPVRIPSKELLRDLHKKYGILDSLTYAGLEGVNVSDDPKSPANWSSDSFLDWWLDRADFYNTDLMPNVRTFNSFEELALDSVDTEGSRVVTSEQLAERNQKIQNGWDQVMEEFFRKL